MADVLTTTNQCALDLTLSKNNAEVTRRITFDVEDVNLMPDIKRALRNSIVPSLVGGGLSTMFQPTNWKDYDETEDEFTCTLVEAKLITKNETQLDLG